MAPPVRKNRLSAMKITEISVVDNPANQAARAPIAKRADDAGKGEPPMRMSIQKFRDEELEDDIIDNGADGADGDDGDDGDTVTIDDIVDAIVDAAEIAAAELEAAPDDDSVQKFAKAIDGAMHLVQYVNELEEAVEEAGSEIAKSKKRADAFEGQIRKLGAEPVQNVADEADLEDIPESVRKRLESADAAAHEARSEVAKMRAREQREAVMKRVEAAGIPQAEAVTDLFIRIEKGASTKKDADFVLDLLKSAQNVSKAGDLLKTLGERQGGEGDQFDVRLAAAVEPIMKAAAAAGSPLTKEEAIAKAYENNPDLYAEYQQRFRKAR